MAKIETRRDEDTFLGKGCTIRTHLLWAATQLPVYFSEIWARGGSQEERHSKAHPEFLSRRFSQRAPKFGTSLWPDRRTHTRTDRQTNRKVPPPAKTYRVARALFSRGRLISDASLPVFHGGGEGPFPKPSDEKTNLGNGIAETEETPPAGRTGIDRRNVPQREKPKATF